MHTPTAYHRTLILSLNSLTNNKTHITQKNPCSQDPVLSDLDLSDIRIVAMQTTSGTQLAPARLGGVRAEAET